MDLNVLVLCYEGHIRGTPKSVIERGRWVYTIEGVYMDQNNSHWPFKTNEPNFEFELILWKLETMHVNFCLLKCHGFSKGRSSELGIRPLWFSYAVKSYQIGYISSFWKNSRQVWYDIAIFDMILLHGAVSKFEHLHIMGVFKFKLRAMYT